MSDDGGHYYKRDGTPCHTVPAKRGGVRNFDLRWDRHMQAVPSVTTVLKIIDKPQLTSWLVKQGILAALSFPRSRSEFADDDAFVQAIRDDSKQQVIDAANEGTRIHQAVEDYFAGRNFPDYYTPHVNGVCAELRKIFPDIPLREWVSEARFAHRSGYGGACDLHHPATGTIADMKGKDGDFSDGKKLGYDQVLQFAAYQDGLHLQRAPGAAIFVSRTHPGCVASYVWDANEMEEASQIFKATLALWKLLKKYDGAF